MLAGYWIARKVNMIYSESNLGIAGKKSNASEQ